MGKKDKLTKLEKKILDTKWKNIILGNIVTNYMVSNDGFIKNDKGVILSPFFIKDRKGNKTYKAIRIKYAGKRYSRLNHRLVAIAFVENPHPETYNQVNHINGIKTDNYDWNLEWVTQSINMKHAADMKLLNPKHGVESPFAIHTETQIHHACSLLEKGEFTVKEISKLTGVSVNTINGIYRDGKWKSISSQYNIIPPIQKRHIRNDELVNKIDELANDLNSREIIDRLGLPDTNANRLFISRRIKKLKLQRLSKAI